MPFFHPRCLSFVHGTRMESGPSACLVQGCRIRMARGRTKDLIRFRKRDPTMRSRMLVRVVSWLRVARVDSRVKNAVLRSEAQGRFEASTL